MRFFILFFTILFVFQAAYCHELPACSKHAMIVTEQNLATDVGIQILKSGGNAFDAAVAVGYALAVVYPCCGNLGGGGFMTAHLANGKNIFINFRERAPLAAAPTMFSNQRQRNIGYLAVATPGTVSGLNYILKKYGKLSLQEVIKPAIQLAEKGFILQRGDVHLLSEYYSSFKSQPNVARVFLKNNHCYKIGDRLIQKDLAHTLKLISKKGDVGFYQGEIPSSIVQESRRHNGILSLKDFKNYFVEERIPIQCTYHNIKIISAAPPSSGGTTLCEMLNILEGYPLKSYKFNSAQSVHYATEAMRYAFSDRNVLGDPNFVTNPVQRLISKKYAATIRKKISRNKSGISKNISGTSSEGMQTTHYSIIDQYGNAVALTTTLNSFFGAKIIAGKTGFFLNDEMDDFSSAAKPNQFGLVQGKNNTIQGGKRPLSSMTPTILLKDNHVMMILGSVGGPRIITAVLETILNVLEFKMNIQNAVDAPRFHHQYIPDQIDYERNAFSQATQKRLILMGYILLSQKPWGAVEAIYVDPISKMIFGANDKRRSAGGALGY